MKHKWVIGLVIIIVVFAVVAFSSFNVDLNSISSDNESSGVVLKVIGEGPWSASITDGDGYVNFYNESNATYSLNGNSSISVTVTKQSNDDGLIEAQLLKDGKVISNQSTNAPLGSVTVKME
ncbi:MAG: hypothetical protein Q4P18_04780 [Methanobrevibacter sp.]|uniref:hypothetical protein n=1 Tax=Methanobrevibacter sp. TaxID=66852 RepID=UPI0026E0142A|nr:hypothetical protein [Methanobrevibacter sp.]MDO5848826.1 hypothetical protein [Methanobrevibacter sp.]